MPFINPIPTSDNNNEKNIVREKCLSDNTHYKQQVVTSEWLAGAIMANVVFLVCAVCRCLARRDAVNSMGRPVVRPRHDCLWTPSATATWNG